MEINLKQKAYRHIRTKLLTRELRPGSPLSHRALANEIGISFTPVRDAIGQLASEGLVETHPKRGTFVTDMSRHDLAELYDVREALECHAAEKAAGQFNEADLGKLEQLTSEMDDIVSAFELDGSKAWTAMDNDRLVIADAMFHMTLLQGAGNGRAVRIFKELRVLTQIFGHRKEDLPIEDLRRICDEHRRVIKALRQGDANLVGKVLAEHLQAGCRRALVAFDRNRLAEAAGQESWVVYPAELQGRIQELEVNAEEEQKPGRKH